MLERNFFFGKCSKDNLESPVIVSLPLLHKSQMVQLQAAEILASLCSPTNYRVLAHHQ